MTDPEPYAGLNEIFRQVLNDDTIDLTLDDRRRCRGMGFDESYFHRR